MLIRHADPARDGAACAAVYAPSVSDGVSSFEERAPSASEMGQRISEVARRWPWLVAEVDGTVAGYAYAAQHHARPAYRWTTDVTVYIDAAHHRRGIGRALYGALFPLLQEQGLYEACAGITLPNPGSVGLHESLGFTPVGIYRNVGFKFGQWWDVGWWQMTLRPHGAGLPPAEPGPPGRLPGSEPGPAG